MTKILRRKMLRDLKNNAVQFLAIFIMCFFAMFIFEGFDSVAEGNGKSFDKYFHDTNYADMILRSEGFTEDDLITVKRQSGVKEAEFRTAINGRIKISEGSKIVEKKIEFNYLDQNEISKMLLSEGQRYEEGSNGIWIDYDFAKTEKIQIGDRLELVCDGIDFSETVRGIIYAPDHASFVIDETYDYPERGAYAYAFLSSSEYPGKKLTFDTIYVDMTDVENQLFLTEDDKKILEKARAGFMTVISKDSLVVTCKDKDAGYYDVHSDIESEMVLETFFPAFFILIAVLGIMTTMTRLTMKQRTVIGTLKALGFSNINIVLHYMSYSVVISLVAGISGAFAGWNILGNLVKNYMDEFYINPYAKLEISSKIIITILSITFISAAVNYLSCRKLLSQRASEILTPEPPVSTGAGFLERTFIWKYLDFVSRWNIRDINRNRGRTIAGIFGIILTSCLMFVSFGADELNRYTESWEYSKLTPADYTINFSSDVGYAQVYDYAKQFSGQMVEEAEVYLYTDNDSESIKSFNITVTDQGNLYRFQDGNGEYISLPYDGIAMSNKAAEDLELSVGDFVRFRFPGEKNIYRGRIRTIYKSPGTQGIAMRRNIFESLKCEFKPNIVYTNMTVPLSFQNERDEIASITSKERLIKALLHKSAGTSDEVLYTMVVSIIVGIVVMYNLGVLSFIEKQHEIATLKVLGFPVGKIRWIFQQQNILITGVGTVLGLLLGPTGLKMLMSNLDVDSDYIYKVSVFPYLWSFLLSFILSVIVNNILSSRIKTIDMVEALKGTE